MTTDIPWPNGVNPWHEANDVYHEVLKWFYGKQNRAKAAPHALHLLRILDKLDPNCEVLLSMSGRCLIAELDGDIEEAIRYRKLELAAVKKLLEELTPVLLAGIGMGLEDYRDRLDLLASNYLDLKRYDDAIAVLAESQSFCQIHKIPFDGKDILSDVKKAIRRRRNAKAKVMAKAG